MSSDKPSLVGVVVLFFSIVNCDVITPSNKSENVWRRAGKLTGLLLQKCMQLSFDVPEEQFLLIFQRCLKRRSLVALDRSLKGDVIKLGSGIEFVRYRQENDTRHGRELAFLKKSHESNEKETDWKHQILQRITHVFDTHILKIRLNSYADLNKLVSVEGRGRKKHNMFMSLLMFGIAAVGLIMVPMGFQFLAVLGGKALLLAKMALILTAIQGLKKIATSNLNYGLYATPPEHHHHQGPCKDEMCHREFNTDTLEDDDSVHVAIDVDHLTQLNNHDIDFWHYDRQWPYEAESHDVLTSHSNYYQAPEQQTDFLHPLHPRVDTFTDMI